MFWQDFIDFAFGNFQNHAFIDYNGIGIDQFAKKDSGIQITFFTKYMIKKGHLFSCQVLISELQASCL